MFSVLVAVVTRDRPDLLGPLAESLTDARQRLDLRGVSLRIRFGDTGSTDPETLRLYSQFSTRDLEVLPLGSYHFSRNNNQLVASAKEDAILFLNNDVLLSDGAETLFRMVAHLQEDNVAIVGRRLHFPSGQIQHDGIGFSRNVQWEGVPFPYHPERLSAPTARTCSAVPAVTGAALLTWRETFQEASGFAEVYSEECQDVDYCLRISRLGFTIVLCREGQPSTHIENATRDPGSECPHDRNVLVHSWRAALKSLALAP